MNSTLIQWCHRLLHLTLPNACLWCELPVQHAEAQLCHYCQASLPRLSLEIVHHNALGLPAIKRGLPHAQFDQLLSLSWYQHPWQRWITQWKFHQDLACGAVLMQLFQDGFREWQSTLQVDAVCYVPMHRQRQHLRGFNQAQQLAEIAAAQLGLPLLHLFHVNADHPSQVGQNRQQRRANLRKQFRLQNHGVLPSRLLLIDDVVTTGATANALCRLLRKRQVSYIALASLAVTKAPGTLAGLYLQPQAYSASPSPPSC